GTFRGAFRSACALRDVARDLDLDDEPAPVLRTAHFERAVHGQGAMRALRPFLQQGLRGFARRGERRGDGIAHRSLNERRRRIESTLDVARAHDRFVEARGESGPSAAAGLFFAAPQKRLLRETELRAYAHYR